MGAQGFIAVALKWVDLRPDVDPLSGRVTHDVRRSGFSPADAAALEWALRLSESWQLPVVAVTAGPAEAEAVLREAAAHRVTRLVRVAVQRDTDSDLVARVLASALSYAAVVCCGDYSPDRGSGSVPAFLAHELGAAQALGLTGLIAEGTGSLVVQRRLDGGRREQLRITVPAVISVEPSSSRLRRAALPGLVAARSARVEVVAADVQPRHATQVSLLQVTPYRPRPKIMPPPSGRQPRERLLALTGALLQRTPPRLVKASADEAADELLGYLKARGYLA